MGKKNAGMQAHEEIMVAIEEIHELEKEVEEIKARLSKSLYKKKTGDISFVSSALYHYQDGRTQKSIHVLYGIEKLAEQLGAEVSTEKESLETATYTDIRKSFTVCDIEYFQLDISPELLEKEKREYEESQRRQEDEENGKQSI